VTALDALRQCATGVGLLASPEAAHNYRRVWARDGIVASLGAIAARCAEGEAWLTATLNTLVASAGPIGQIPSNVSVDDRCATVGVSYGGAAVRVDAPLWFMVGAGVLGRLQPSRDRALWPSLLRARALARAWEGNERGLVYVPRAGNWADEYPVLGYTLYDNTLRIWAEGEVDAMAARLGEAVETRDRWTPLREQLVGDEGLLAYVGPGVRCDRFCGFGHALFALLAEGDEASQAIDAIEARLDRGLLPAFWPPVEAEDPGYAMLEALAAYGMRNQPGRYHNGGLWPVVAGVAALAARKHGREALADRLHAGIVTANHAGDFPEFIDAQDGTPGGTRRIAWSAGAELMASPAADARRLGARRPD